MAGKPGRQPVRTSFKPGNKAALGNDKTTRVSTWLEKELHKLSEVEDYEGKLSYAKLIARNMVQKAVQENDITFIREVLDRTEGKPAQSTDITSKGEKVETLSIVLTKDNE